MNSVARAAADNRPTLGALIAAFLGSLLQWGLSFVPDTVPEEVVVTGHGLALAIVAMVVGYVVQYVGENATWSNESHMVSVVDAYLQGRNESSGRRPGA